MSIDYNIYRNNSFNLIIIVILRVKKNIIKTRYSQDQVGNKRECRAYNTINYVNTTFGQRFLDHLGAVCFNKMDLETKKKVCSKSYNSA